MDRKAPNGTKNQVKAGLAIVLIPLAIAGATLLQGCTVYPPEVHPPTIYPPTIYAVQPEKPGK